MRDTHCEVLIVGAGPTGLMAANLLRRSGVDVRIVEKREGASRESRAFAIMARSMELFDQLGLAERILDHAVLNPGIDFFVAGKRVGGLDYDRADSPDTPFPFITLHPQARTEALLIEDLRRQGLEVERGIEVTGLEQDENGVRVFATGPDGSQETIRCAYTVGADGAHSAVRHALGLRFDGAPYAQTFMLADCRVQWPEGSSLDHARFRVFVRGETIALFLPLEEQRCSRVMLTEHPQAGQGDAEPDLAALEAAYRQVTGLDVHFSDAVWKTRYHVHHRGVSQYGKGRVFIAGDAAHIHSPAGGQGMNTGLQDAANLAWKLAAVLRRPASSALLDSYDAERLPIGRQVVATTDKLFSLAAGATGWETVVRDWLAGPAMAAMSKMGRVQRAAFRKLAQLELRYPTGEFVEDEAPELDGCLAHVGGRAPNARLDRYRDLFDLTRGYGFTLLALSRRALEQELRTELLDALAELAEPGVSTHLIARTAHGRDTRTLVPTEPRIFEAYGLDGDQAQALYLVRSDGYIAWRGLGLDLSGVRAALQRFGFSGGVSGRTA